MSRLHRQNHHCLRRVESPFITGPSWHIINQIARRSDMVGLNRFARCLDGDHECRARSTGSNRAASRPQADREPTPTSGIDLSLTHLHHRLIKPTSMSTTRTCRPCPRRHPLPRLPSKILITLSRARLLKTAWRRPVIELLASCFSSN